MNDPHLATREVLWNIGHAWVMYALLLPTLAIAAYGIYARVRSLAARAGGKPLGSTARANGAWSHNTRCCNCAPGASFIRA